MEKESKKLLLCVLKNIKYKADLTPKDSLEDIEIKKEVLRRVKKSREGIVESSKREANYFFPFLLGKRIRLDGLNLNKCGLNFNMETENLLKVLKEKRVLKNFKLIINETGKGDGNFFELILSDKFDEIYRRLSHTLEVGDNKKSEKIKIPVGTTWKKITLRFKNKYDVEIIINEKSILSNYEKMGFADERIKKPEETTRAKSNWDFLWTLSINGGAFPLGNLPKVKREIYKKQKQGLAKILKERFEIDDDPFEKYDKRADEFRIKINLIPEPEFREQYVDKIKGIEDERTNI
jgi:hypothetical protein